MSTENKQLFIKEYVSLRGGVEALEEEEKNALRTLLEVKAPRTSGEVAKKIRKVYLAKTGKSITDEQLMAVLYFTMPDFKKALDATVAKANGLG